MQSVAVVHPHLLIWRDPPVWPFVWRGLLPLLALVLAASFALGPVARNWIEGPVRRETRAQLDAASFGWVGLSVSGQDVMLSGEFNETEDSPHEYTESLVCLPGALNCYPFQYIVEGLAATQPCTSGYFAATCSPRKVTALRSSVGLAAISVGTNPVAA